jgi:hypothetical protein
MCGTKLGWKSLSIVGAGTDERAIIETLCTRSNAEINDIKRAYADFVSFSALLSVMVAGVLYAF